MRYVRLLVLFLVPSLLFADPLKEAQDFYQQAEKSSVIADREHLFNQALKIYSEHEIAHPKLLYNIGNCYYQLNQIGMAIWYYKRALKLNPRDDKVKENMSRALKQAGSISKKDSFSLTRYLSSKELSFLFITLCVLSSLFFSIFVWKKGPKVQIVACTCLLCCVFVGFLISKNQGNQNQAVIVQPALLRCDAGFQYKEIDNQLIELGKTVSLIEFSDDQQWAYVKVAHKKKGYVPRSCLGIY